MAYKIKINEISIELGSQHSDKTMEEVLKMVLKLAENMIIKKIEISVEE